jgi:hypothetical protein
MKGHQDFGRKTTGSSAYKIMKVGPHANSEATAGSLRSTGIHSKEERIDTPPELLADDSIVEHGEMEGPGRVRSAHSVVSASPNQAPIESSHLGVHISSLVDMAISAVLLPYQPPLYRTKAPSSDADP